MGRKSAEELRFQREMEEAMRLSSEEVSSSSQEIVPCKSEAEAEQETDILVTDKTFDQEPKGYGDIVNKVIAEAEITAVAKPAERKRKVEEWVVEKKERRRSKPKRYVVESSGDEDEDFVDENSDEDDDFEASGTSTKKKVKLKEDNSKKKDTKSDNTRRSTPRKSKEIKSKVEDDEPLPPQKPLADHNRLAGLPKCPNMFQNKSPVRLKVGAKPPQEQQPEAVTPASPAPATPGLSSSLSAILGKLGSKGTPKVTSKPTSSPCPSPASARAPVTPVQKRLPSWTPPARAGAASPSPAASPSIGLRLGLSRNYKSKPLHPSVKS